MFAGPSTCAPALHGRRAASFKGKLRAALRQQGVQRAWQSAGAQLLDELQAEDDTTELDCEEEEETQEKPPSAQARLAKAWAAAKKELKQPLPVVPRCLLAVGGMDEDEYTQAVVDGEDEAVMRWRAQLAEAHRLTFQQSHWAEAQALRKQSPQDKQLCGLTRCFLSARMELAHTVADLFGVSVPDHHLSKAAVQSLIHAVGKQALGDTADSGRSDAIQQIDKLQARCAEVEADREQLRAHLAK